MLNDLSPISPRLKIQKSQLMRQVKKKVARDYEERYMTQRYKTYGLVPEVYHHNKLKKSVSKVERDRKIFEDLMCCDEDDHHFKQ